MLYSFDLIVHVFGAGVQGRAGAGGLVVSVPIGHNERPCDSARRIPFSSGIASRDSNDDRFCCAQAGLALLGSYLECDICGPTAQG